MTDPPTAAECNTEAAATAGMGTAARMTRVRAAAKIESEHPTFRVVPSRTWTWVGVRDSDEMM